HHVAALLDRRAHLEQRAFQFVEFVLSGGGHQLDAAMVEPLPELAEGLAVPVVVADALVQFAHGNGQFVAHRAASPDRPGASIVRRNACIRALPAHDLRSWRMSTAPAFASLDLPATLLQGIDALGYQSMTPVQAQALPAILAGRDVIAQAPTGSGKTAAFGLGLLSRLDPARIQTQALVLCPTRELADQVGKQLRKLAIGIPNLKLSILCGGIPLGPQL